MLLVCTLIDDKMRQSARDKIDTYCKNKNSYVVNIRLGFGTKGEIWKQQSRAEKWLL